MLPGFERLSRAVSAGVPAVHAGSPVPRRVFEKRGSEPAAPAVALARVIVQDLFPGRINEVAAKMQSGPRRAELDAGGNSGVAPLIAQQIRLQPKPLLVRGIGIRLHGRGVVHAADVEVLPRRTAVPVHAGGDPVGKDRERVADRDTGRHADDARRDHRAVVRPREKRQDERIPAHAHHDIGIGDTQVQIGVLDRKIVVHRQEFRPVPPYSGIALGIREELSSLEAYVGGHVFARDVMESHVCALQDVQGDKTPRSPAPERIRGKGMLHVGGEIHFSV